MSTAGEGPVRLWGGRFGVPPAGAMFAMPASVFRTWRLWAELDEQLAALHAEIAR